VDRNMQLNVATPETLEGHLTKVNNLLYYIGGPYRDDLLHQLTSLFDVIVIDHPSFAPVESLKGEFLLVIDQDLQTLENTDLYLEYVNQMVVAVNKYNINALPLELIQSKLGKTDIISLPRDDFSCINALAGEMPAAKVSKDLAFSMGEILAKLSL